MMATAFDPPIPRLMAAVEDGRRAAGRPETVVLGAGPGFDPAALRDAAASARVLVLSAVGAHPDGPIARWRQLWELEELARASGRPVLTLRLAPMLGPQSPLWLRLRSRPSGRGLAGRPFNPVLEEDVIETVTRALEGRASWEGWYDVAGSEALTVPELVSLAAQTPRLEPEAGAWEPPLAELRELGLVESEPWAEHFGIAPGRITERAPAWS